MKSLAIVGATGVVGRCVLKVLEEEKLNIDEYVLFSSKKSVGSNITFMDKSYIVEELTDNSFYRSYDNTNKNTILKRQKENDKRYSKRFDFAIFCAGGEVSEKFVPIAKNIGTIVIDNSSYFRMDKNVPLVVPEVNPEEITKHHGIIANPNCSTIQAIVPLKILDKLYGIKRVVYSTYQAVSGAGRNGIIDLENGIENFKSKNSYKLNKFEYPIFNNVLPHIDIFEENGYTKEELKMINETRKILKRPNLKVTATCARVPVFNSHAESINVEFEKECCVDVIKNAFKVAKGIKLLDEPNKNIYPIQDLANGTNEIYVGRIRKDFSVKSGINFWVVADNIRKGAATNAVQILEKLI